jgi:hypothetical protein
VIPAPERADDIQSVPRLRRLTAVLVCALAFCGVAAAAATKAPQYQLASADQSWAESIVVTSKDVGAGWSRSGTIGPITGADDESATCSVPDESDLVLTGGSYSPDFFRNDGAYVSSSAMVWQTAEQAQADWDRHIQPGLLSCLAADLQASSTKRIKVRVTSRRQLAWPSMADRSAVFRLSVLLTATVKANKTTRKVSARATADFIAVGTGRATAMLATLSFNRQPLGDFNKQQLAMLMARRTAADPATK